MKWLAELFSYCLMAVFAQNIVFIYGIGSSRMLRAARKPKTLLAYAGFVTLYTFFTTLLSFIANPIVGNNATARPLAYCVCAVIAYCAVTPLVRIFFSEFYGNNTKIFPVCALNCVVIGVPLIANQAGMGFFHALMYALGTGLGFAAAIWLTREAIGRLENPDMPKAFRGLPALFLYLGILTMVFLSVKGGGLLPG